MIRSTKKLGTFFGAIAVVITVVLGAFSGWHTWTCQNSGKNCDKSVLGPPVKMIGPSDVGLVRTTLQGSSEISLLEVAPLLGSKKLIVSADSKANKVNLGVFDLGKQKLVAFAEFPEHGKYVLITELKRRNSNRTEEFEIHTFSTVEPFQYNYTLLTCKNPYEDRSVRLSNIRWREPIATDHANAKNFPLSFDIISTCEFINMNESMLVNFGRHADANGRVELSFSNDLILIGARSRRAGELEKLSEESRQRAFDEIDKCVSNTESKGTNGWITFCARDYFVPSMSSVGEHRTYFAVVGSTGGEVFRHDWICDGSNSAERRIVSPDLAYISCSEKLKAPYNHPEPLKFAAKQYSIAIFPFSAKAQRLDIIAYSDLFEIKGVDISDPHIVSFDLYVDTQVIEVGGRNFEVSDRPVETTPDTTTAPYAGRFRANLSPSGAIVSLERQSP